MAELPIIPYWPLDAIKLDPQACSNTFAPVGKHNTKQGFCLLKEARSTRIAFRDGHSFAEATVRCRGAPAVQCDVCITPKESVRVHRMWIQSNLGNGGIFSGRPYQFADSSTNAPLAVFQPWEARYALHGPDVTPTVGGLPQDLCKHPLCAYFLPIDAVCFELEWLVGDQTNHDAEDRSESEITIKVTTHALNHVEEKEGFHCLQFEFS